MKKPQPRPAEEPADLEVILAALDVTQLTALLKRVQGLREEKLFAAKRDLIARFREEAYNLGLDFNEITKPLTKSANAQGPTAPVPPDWENRVVHYLETHEGRANSTALYRAVWPDGKAGSGSGPRLRGHLKEMVERGILLLLRKGAAGNPGIYGLASMIEAPEQEVAAE